MRISKYIILYFCGGSLIPHSPHSSEIPAPSNPVPLPDLHFDSFSYPVASIVFGDMAIVSLFLLLFFLANHRSCLERYRLPQIPGRLDRNFIFHFVDAALKRFWSALDCFFFFRPTKQKQSRCGMDQEEKRQVKSCTSIKQEKNSTKNKLASLFIIFSEFQNLEHFANVCNF